MNIWRLIRSLLLLCIVNCIYPVDGWLFGKKRTPAQTDPWDIASPTDTVRSPYDDNRGYGTGGNNDEGRASALVPDYAGGGESASTAGGYPGMELRTIDKWKLADFLLVGTIDGSLHARDRHTGVELWSIPGDTPLVTVSSSKVLQQDQQLQDESEITWIVEPLEDGILYYFMPSTGLHRLPVSIKQLVLESPFAIHGDDKIYTGSRQTTLYSINASTGAIVKVYGDRVGLGKAECKAKPSFFRSSEFEYGDDDDEYFHLHDEDDNEAEEDNGTFMIGRTGK